MLSPGGEVYLAPTLRPHFPTPAATHDDSGSTASLLEGLVPVRLLCPGPVSELAWLHDPQAPAPGGSLMLWTRSGVILGVGCGAVGQESTTQLAPAPLMCQGNYGRHAPVPLETQLQVLYERVREARSALQTAGTGLAAPARGQAGAGASAVQRAAATATAATAAGAAAGRRATAPGWRRSEGQHGGVMVWSQAATCPSLLLGPRPDGAAVQRAVHATQGQLQTLQVRGWEWGWDFECCRCRGGGAITRAAGAVMVGWLRVLHVPG